MSLSLLWINGSPCPSSTGRTYDVRNSGSQAVVGRAACASSEDVLAAIEAADAAQPAWEALRPSVKRDILLKAAELIQKPEWVKRVLHAVQEETSSHMSFAGGEAMATVTQFRDAATNAMNLRGDTMPTNRLDGGTILVEKRPWGTVFAMAPSNSPVNLAARAIVIPLACGNTVVLKSSEFSPRCAEIIVEVLHEAGLPKGVLNLIHIAVEDTPKAVSDIIGDKRIRHINFTGSERVGKILAAEAAKYLKPCVFELGGKCPVVVLDDANVEEAARSITYGAMFHSGQICMSTDRVIVQSGISEALITALTTLARKIHANAEPSAHIGPLISSSSAERVVSLLTDAHARGAEVLVGDLTHHDAILQPHILLGVEPGWPLWERESFGPVFAIKIADTEDELIELANQTDYSLMGALWTRDLDKGLKLARRIRVGQVQINAPTFSPEPGVCVHGLGGATGYGRFDIEHFTRNRAVVIAPPNLQLPLVGSL
ncbi:Aldehyde/histidinol dehydrogenase [Gautieria morchelliformis]|nr:Aldehyde/histidinol dehydrogenase [Gautieria morchelliformis]